LLAASLAALASRFPSALLSLALFPLASVGGYSARMATPSMSGPQAGSSSTPGLWMTSVTVLSFALKAQAYESQPLLP